MGGFVCGALAVVTMREGMLFLLFHHGGLWPPLLDALGRPPFPGWDLSRAWLAVPGLPWPVPLFLRDALLGGAGGWAVAALLRWTPVPDLLGGFALGALGATGLALALGLAPAGDAAFWRFALLNGAWGWGAAFWMRPLEVRRYDALRMRHAWAPKD